MDTITLGDLTVARMGLGAMRLCGPWARDAPNGRAPAPEVLRRAVDLGITLVDTADSYGPFVNEEQIAQALYPYPADLVIATKGGMLRPTPTTWKRCGRPEHLRRAIDGSLKRLRLQRIDLYQLHWPDPEVPLAESLGAIADACRAGKVRHVGVSNVSLGELETALQVCPIVSVQNRYHLGDRGSQDVLQACERLGIAFLPWRPLAAGAAIEHVGIESVARRHGATAAQVSLAWLLATSKAMLPIPGTASLEHLEQNCAAAKLELDDRDLEALR